MTYWKNTVLLLNIVGLDWLRCTFITYSSLSIWLIIYSRRWSSLTNSLIWLLSLFWIGRQKMPSTLKARREKAHKGESLRPDNKQAPPCYGSRCIVHNVWVFNAHWITTGRIFKYHWRWQPVWIHLTTLHRANLLPARHSTPWYKLHTLYLRLVSVTR